jgi:uncharacterized protein
MIVGVVSDTHGLLRPEVVKVLSGSDHILHAGDIGALEIIPALEHIAPVTAIRGNIDREPWAQRFPESELTELAGVHIYLIHDLHSLDLNPQVAGLAAVVSGHTHQPKQEVRNGVLYFNPGSAGPRRFNLPISVGKLEVKDGLVRGKVLFL